MENFGARMEGSARGLDWFHPVELPCAVFDHERCVIKIEEYREQRREELSAMYDTFLPKAEAQELPPAKKKVREKWIDDCVKAGPNFIAYAGGGLAGHSMLAPMPGGERAEFSIFIHQDYKHRQIGTNLTMITICRAAMDRFKTLWLTVEQNNANAIALYKFAGFKFTECSHGELCMELDLNSLLLQKPLDDSV